MRGGSGASGVGEQERSEKKEGKRECCVGKENLEEDFLKARPSSFLSGFMIFNFFIESCSAQYCN